MEAELGISAEGVVADRSHIHPLDVLVRRALDPADPIFGKLHSRPLVVGLDSPEMPPRHPLSCLYAPDAEVYIFDPDRDDPDHEEQTAHLDYTLILDALNHPTAFFRLSTINKLQKRDPLGDQAPENLGLADPTPWQEAVVMRTHALNAIRALPAEERLAAVEELGLEPSRLDQWHIVGKCRQAMMSTVLSLAIILRDAMYFRGLQCVIAANSDAVATELFRRIRLAYRHLPKCLRVPLDQSQKSGSERRMTFLHGGFIKVISLGGPTAGIGHAVDRIILSEWGEILDQTRAAGNVFPAFNQRGNAQVFLESTWGAFGSDHQQKWFAALDNQGRFHPIFVPWWRLEPLQADVPPDFKRTEEEERLAEIIYRYSQSAGLSEEASRISDGHLMFRRLETVSTFRGSYPKFDSKYPPSPYHGWLGGGNTLMPADAIADMLAEADQRPALREGPYGAEIFDEPSVDEMYVLIADTAGYSKRGSGDPSALVVLRARDGHEVAAWRGQVLPEQMADIIVAVQKLYSPSAEFPCAIALERAGGTISVLRDRNVHPIWYDTDGLPGWKATQSSIEQGTARLAEGLRSRRHKLRSRSGLLELAQYNGDWKPRQKRADNTGARHHFDQARCYVIAADIFVTTVFRLPRKDTEEEAALRQELVSASAIISALRSRAAAEMDQELAPLFAGGAQGITAAKMLEALAQQEANRVGATPEGVRSLYDPDAIAWGITGDA